MGVARTWVFPIIRIVLVAVLAAALVKLAFFPDSVLRRPIRRSRAGMITAARGTR